MGFGCIEKLTFKTILAWDPRAPCFCFEQTRDLPGVLLQAEISHPSASLLPMTAEAANVECSLEKIHLIAQWKHHLLILHLPPRPLTPFRAAVMS